MWQIAERFGWPLEYIEDMPLARWHELIQVDDGKAKAQQSLFAKRGS